MILGRLIQSGNQKGIVSSIPYSREAYKGINFKYNYNTNITSH
jgi:hypothetical protein